MSTNFGSLLRKSVPFLYLGGGTITGFAVLYPNTIGLENYRKMVAIHAPNGHEEKVDMEFRVLAEEIKADYEWSKQTLESTESTTLFTSSALDFTRFGTSKSRWGCQIAVPKYYFQSDPKAGDGTRQLDRLLSSMKIDPASEAGVGIKQSYNISHAAKKFALAREMKLSKNYQIYFIAAGAQVAISSLYLFPNLVWSVLPFPGVKLITLLSLGPLYYAGFLKALKLSDRVIDSNANKAAASISSEVANGGLEYYNALLLRSKWINTPESESGSGSGSSAEIDWKRLFHEIFRKPWNFSFLTLQDRIDNLKQIIEASSKKQDS